MCIRMDNMSKIPKGDSFSWELVGVPELETLHIFSLLVRYIPVCEVSRSSVLKPKSKPLSPKESDFPTLSRPTEDGSGLHCSVLLCSHSCGPWGLWEAQRHSHHQGQHPTHSYILLTSLFLGSLCFLLSIGLPNTGICIPQQTTFAFVFTVAFYTVLGKIISVVLAFKTKGKGRGSGWYQEHLTLSFPSVPWSKSLSRTRLGLSPPFIEMNTHADPTHITGCIKGSVTAFYCVLGYMGSLTLGSTAVAFWARNLPDTFNEVKFKHAGVLQCLGHILPCLSQHHGGHGDLFHLGLQCRTTRLNLCPQVLY